MSDPSGWIAASAWAFGFGYATYKVTLQAVVEESEGKPIHDREIGVEVAAALITAVVVLPLLWWWLLLGDWIERNPGVSDLRRRLAEVRERDGHGGMSRAVRKAAARAAERDARIAQLERDLGINQTGRGR